MTADKPKHTPGPWEYGKRGMMVDAKNGHMRICDIRGWGHLTGRGAMNLPEDEAIEIQTANAHLIAAAPEMLSALKLMVSPVEHLSGCLWRTDKRMPCQCGWHDRIDAAMAEAKAAIAKAEGQS